MHVYAVTHAYGYHSNDESQESRSTASKSPTHLQKSPPNPQKKVLHICKKRPTHVQKEAYTPLHVNPHTRCQRQRALCIVKEPCIFAKELYIFSKEPYKSTKEPYTSAKKSLTHTYMYTYTRGGDPKKKNGPFAVRWLTAKSPIYLQKSPIYLQKGPYTHLHIF